MAVRFGLYSPSPQDRTAFTVRTNFTSPEGLDYFHQKVWRGCMQYMFAVTDVMLL